MKGAGVYEPYKALDKEVFLKISNKGGYASLNPLVSIPSQFAVDSTKGRVNLDIYNSGRIQAGVLNQTQQPFNNFTFLNEGEVESKEALQVGFKNSASIKNSGSIILSESRDPLHFKGYDDGSLEFANDGEISLSNGNLSYFVRIEQATSGKTLSASLSNTGTLNVRHKDGYSVYLVNISNGVEATLRTFKIPARHYIFSAPNDFIGGGSFVFNSDTKLILTPDDSAEADTTLSLYSKNPWSDGPGIFVGTSDAVKGSVGEANFTTNDEESWKVELIRDEASPDDWKTHKVRVYYEAKHDAGSQMNVYLSRADRDRAFRYEALLEPMKVRMKRNVFIRPFTTQSSYRFIDDSTIKTSGVLMGFSVGAGEAYEHGVHFGYESTDFDSESGRQKADTDSLTLGYHAWWRPIEHFYVKGVASGTCSSSDFTYHALQESSKTDFNSWSFFAYVKSGYDFDAGGLGVFTPEAGFSYIHGRVEDFGLDFAADDLTDRRFHLKNNNDLYASAELKWRAEISNGSGAVLLPRASIGARALLTDRKLEAESYWSEDRHSALIEDDRWQGTAEIGAGILSGSLEFDLLYSGAYSRRTTSHAAWITMGWHW